MIEDLINIYRLVEIGEPFSMIIGDEDPKHKLELAKVCYFKVFS